ncbi:unnamed protein product [Phytophthora lilii]|uniref:Unnamed protein product n=1 Tax=Phytophthora lilii TaxID=2077276 RepID=A0A9W6WQ54_9STRA|nr:unnamed protein product [Phytophthora lilii]
MHRIRNRLVRDTFAFYKANNHLYVSVKESEHVPGSECTDEVVEAAFVERMADPDGKLDEAMNKEQESVRGESDAWRVLCGTNECCILERRIGFADNGAPVQARGHPAVAQGGAAKEREFEARRSNYFANDISGSLLARAFLNLFPFGRGHPGEDRRVKVSVQECVKYYTMLSERQFAEDELFTLVAFDKISLMNMYIQNHICCHRFPHLLEGYDTLSTDQLSKALLENERRRQGCLPWRPADDSVAQKFLKSVEIGSRSVWDSNAERSQCRHRAFAYQTRFGQPALFVTLTPNSDNSLVVLEFHPSKHCLIYLKLACPPRRSCEKPVDRMTARPPACS